MSSTTITTAGATNRHRALPPAPPRDIQVTKFAESRAAELASLHAAVSHRLDDDFRSRRNKRRRTTSFKNRRKHRSSAERENDGERKVPRRVRRRVEFRRNEEVGFGVTGDGTRRLRTHVWHAKRFSMGKVWGFCLPLGLHGRGRGSRALLKWYKQGAVVHDASYHSVVQLEGPEDALLSIVCMLLVPSLIDHSEDNSKFILSGDIYGKAMLQHAGQNASTSAICPVTYLWRPCHQQDNGLGAVNRESEVNMETELTSKLRQLWMWMHPSAFGEGFDCLKLVCQKMMDEEGVMVHCVSLDGQLARLEVLGSESFKLIQKILHPFTSICSMVEDTNKCAINQERNLRKEECFCPSAAISLTVVDPRLTLLKSSAAVPDAQLASDPCCVEEDKINGNSAGNLHKKEEVLSTLQSKYDSNASLSDCKDLWDASKGIHLPVEEHILCQERHQKSLDFFCLKDASSAKFVSSEDSFSRCCPILLLRNTHQEGVLTGWSIILPLSWVKAFWIPLVSGGAHAIGLREKHWIASDVGLPYFPSDFPDCNAYSCHIAIEAAAVDKSMEGRPPARRPFKVPVLLPWNSKSFAFDEGAGQGTGMGSSGNVGANGDHQGDLDGVLSDVPPNDPCEVFVARTSRMLTNFLKEISGNHLLLFPNRLHRESFSHLMKDETKIIQASTLPSLTSRRSRLYYLRVLLHAFKEGVFDEGAVVCAPRFSDISLWTLRSEDVEAEGLHVPDAFVGSYFKELSPGKWDIQLPEDPAAREAFRQPIGFVTTGFVRGSKRPSAVALCEAALLARLRHEQWSQTPAKRRRKEIFVLVRNMRSTAYRLALATIVLECQENDVEFL